MQLVYTKDRNSSIERLIVIGHKNNSASITCEDEH